MTGPNQKCDNCWKSDYPTTVLFGHRVCDRCIAQASERMAERTRQYQRQRELERFNEASVKK